jgi:protein-S-isoprenylcysteine O-methyltransferase Ste14
LTSEPSVYKRLVVSAALVSDGLIVAAWATIVLDLLLRGGADASGGGVLIAGRPPLRPALRVALVAVTVGCFAALERETGRVTFDPTLAAAGLALAIAAVALHFSARRALGSMWSPAAMVRAGHEVVERGPYRVVRHPLYLAMLMLGAGTGLVHPSPATACLLIGLAVGTGLKIRMEERLLRQALPGYRQYAARVPSLLPRLRHSSAGPRGPK